MKHTFVQNRVMILAMIMIISLPTKTTMQVSSMMCHATRIKNAMLDKDFLDSTP